MNERVAYKLNRFWKWNIKFFFLESITWDEKKNFQMNEEINIVVLSDWIFMFVVLCSFMLCMHSVYAQPDKMLRGDINWLGFVNECQE